MSEYKNHNYYTPDQNSQPDPVDSFDVEEIYTVSTTKSGEKKKRNPMNRGIDAYRGIITFAICICVSFIIAYIISNYLIRPTKVDGDSMSYNLADGDVLILDLVKYKFSKPSRFDIVVFKPNKDENNFIKRVIGLPGETVQIKDGQIYINDVLLNENFGYGSLDEAGVAKEPVVLGEDEYFVLGDYRIGSIDSRNPYVGNVKEDTIIGKAVLKIWPLRSFGTIDNEKNSRVQAGKEE